VCGAARGHSAPDGRRNLSPRSSLVVSASECSFSSLLVRRSAFSAKHGPVQNRLCLKAFYHVRRFFLAENRFTRTKRDPDHGQNQQILCRAANKLPLTRYAGPKFSDQQICPGRAVFACVRACARKTASRERSSTMRKL
jgi:hypothetical protein